MSDVPMRCEECGFVYETPRDEIAQTIRAFGPAYRDVLASASADTLRAHPVEATWSALEYACHFRDVLDTQVARIARALTEDEPTYTPMGRDELVTERRYNEQDPAIVADGVVRAADELAATFEALDDGGWERTGVYTYPVVASRTVEWIGWNTIHEGEHHLLDVERLLATRAVP
jgi:hypothetical protein